MSGKRLRAAWRLLRVAHHLCNGLAIVAFLYPRSDAARQHLYMQRWSAKLLDVLGIRLSWSGTVPQSGMLVSNHISFIDVFAINAIVPAAFVAKDDVRSWPLIGWLCRNTGTLFLERGSRSAAQRAREEIVARLQTGAHVAVFPEGTTSNGDAVQPFHSAMFQSAIDADVPVTPIAIAYTDATAKRSHAAAYIGDMSLLECFWSIACADGLTIIVALLAPHRSGETDRRHLSAHVHRGISHHLESQSSLSGT